MARILVVDDDAQVRKLLVRIIKKIGYIAAEAGTLEEGLAQARSTRADLVLLDVYLPDGNGLDILPKLRSLPSSPEVIILTGQGNADGAETAIRAGAWEYLQKPPEKQVVTLTLTRALQYRLDRRKIPEAHALDLSNIVGNCSKIRSCIEQLAHAAASESSVQISGETGTGKELFAWAIHRNSARKSKNFVVVDCAALPEGLVESTLFGHEKGAFTGADRTRKGLVMEADGGTLFLDEVGELPLKLQKSFLRVLQDGVFRPVGGKDHLKSDFRLISATNRSLDKMVEEGHFRKDLLYRIRSTALELPPLRERENDISALALHFLGRLCERYKIENKGLTPEFLNLLKQYSWPGNVRELSHVIEHSLTQAGDSDVLFPKHLPTYLRVSLARASVTENGDPKDILTNALPIPPMDGSFRKFRDLALSMAEKAYLENLMARTNSNVREACGLSELSRARLYALLKKHGIERSS